jgi:hypothetical protein
VIKGILVQNADTSQNYLIHYANAAVKQNTKDQDVKIHEMDIRDRHHLIELWHKQCQALGGPYCIFTGVEMTTIKNRGDGRKNGRTATNVSVDRLDASKPYNEENIVFLHLGV